MKKTKPFKGKLTINIKLTETELMEFLLNTTTSGLDYSFLLFFAAFENNWHIDKLRYYSGLLEESKQ